MANTIAKLRSDPESTVNTYDLYFDFRGVQNEIRKANEDEVGTKCTFACGMPSKQNIVTITVKNGGSDYYFPWVPRGVGSVAVPVSVPNGTIVATGQLNGCTFEVIQSGGSLYFYHDGDSKFLRKKVQPVNGNQLCVVAPDDYMPTDLGGTLMGITQMHAKAANDVTLTRAYCYQLFAVKHNDTWKVFSCGLLLFNGQPTDAFRETDAKLVATFSPESKSGGSTVRPRAATI